MYVNMMNSTELIDQLEFESRVVTRYGQHFFNFFRPRSTLRGHLVNLKQYRDDQQFPCIRMNRFTKRFIDFFLIN